MRDGMSKATPVVIVDSDGIAIGRAGESLSKNQALSTVFSTANSGKVIPQPIDALV